MATPPDPIRVLRGLADQARRIDAAVSIANYPRDRRLSDAGNLLAKAALLIEGVANDKAAVPARSVTHVRDDAGTRFLGR